RAVRPLSDLPPMDRLRAVIAAIRVADPLRDDRRPPAVAATGRGLIATLVGVLSPINDGPRGGPSIASRLWPRLTSRRATGDRVRALDATPGLLAHHDLAAA